MWISIYICMTVIIFCVVSKKDKQLFNSRSEQHTYIHTYNIGLFA